MEAVQQTYRDLFDTLPANVLATLYEQMVLIRQAEEAVSDLVGSGEAKCPCHLYIGQEAIAVGVCSALETHDYLWGGHRSHGHYLAKGGDIASMLAEILGKSTGCSGGRGGSMHLFAADVGIFGTVPLVTATVPLAVGSALASKLRGDGRISVCFFGDGAIEEGHCHESMNLAALYALPVVFVCENNFYASHMSLGERRLADNIWKAGELHGIPAVQLDGNDITAVRSAATVAAERARSGNGPTLLECRTYRWRGHVGASWDMDVGVKRRDELHNWLPLDPIARTRIALMREGVTEEQVQQIESSVSARVTAALEFARRSPGPSADEVRDHVYFAGKAD